MTRYDPFSYGEVPLDTDQRDGAAPLAEEDLLFAAQEDVKQAPPADAGWGAADVAPPTAEVTDEAMQFGADVLGEDAAHHVAEPTEQRPAPALAPLPAEVPATTVAAQAPTRPEQARSRPEHAPRQRIQTAPPRAVAAPRRGLPLLAAFVPMVLLTGGGAGSAWLWMTQANPVLAGIAGAATVVGALFTRLLLRG